MNALVSATEFYRQAGIVARYFGFQPLELARQQATRHGSKTKGNARVPVAERKMDAMHGLLTGGAVAYLDNNLRSITEPIFFYSFERVPRSGEAAVVLQVYGVRKSIAEAILIQTSRAIVSDFGYKNHVVRVNSMGDEDSITRYTRELTNFLRRRAGELPITTRELMKKHVLVALQQLIEKDHELAARSPNTIEHLSDPARRHFREIIEFLDVSNTPYEIDPRLLGHHQCYSDTLFNIDALVEPDTRLVDPPLTVFGGRYNHFTQRHVPDAPAAAGVVIILRNKTAPKRLPRTPDLNNTAVTVVQIGLGPKIRSLLLLEELRGAGIAVQHNLTTDSLSQQLLHAEETGVRYAIIIGQKEFVDGTVLLRDLQMRTQNALPADLVVGRLKRFNAVVSAT